MRIGFAIHISASNRRSASSGSRSTAADFRTVNDNWTIDAVIRMRKMAVDREHAALR